MLPIFAAHIRPPESPDLADLSEIQGESRGSIDLQILEKGADEAERPRHPTPTSLTRIGRARKQPRDGAVAQMGERCNRTAEVRGSNPLSSTNVKAEKIL